MPNVNIYLNKELYDFVKDDPSKRVQLALEEFIESKEVSDNS